MVTTIKVLKRRDGASIIVAIVVAMILMTMLTSVTAELAGKLSGLNDGQFGFAYPGSGVRGQYLHPIIWAILQLLALELLLWLYGVVHESLKKK